MWSSEGICKFLVSRHYHFEEVNCEETSASHFSSEFSCKDQWFEPCLCHPGVSLDNKASLHVLQGWRR